MNDFWAGVAIDLQNFNARFGVAAIIILALLVFALIMSTVIKTVIKGQSKERKVQLRAKKAEDRIRIRASESLSQREL